MSPYFALMTCERLFLCDGMAPIFFIETKRIWYPRFAWTLIGGCEDLGPTCKVLQPIVSMPRPRLGAHLKILGVPQARLDKAMRTIDDVEFDEFKYVSSLTPV
jgi:hypothetical protein